MVSRYSHWYQKTKGLKYPCKIELGILPHPNPDPGMLPAHFSIVSSRVGQGRSALEALLSPDDLKIASGPHVIYWFSGNFDWHILCMFFFNIYIYYVYSNIYISRLWCGPLLTNFGLHNQGQPRPQLNTTSITKHISDDCDDGDDICNTWYPLVN